VIGSAEGRPDHGAPLGESGALSRSSDASTVRVWRIVLDAVHAPSAEAVAELSEEERARAARFATDALRNRWLHGHVATRRILARELGVAPFAIGYGAESAGKPFVATPAGSGIQFSFSDSGERALLAVGRHGVLGVDVEVHRPLSDLEGIAERFFAREERAALFAVPDDDRETAFYRLWTRKEAYIKALGTGLGHPLSRFVMTLASDDVRLVTVDDDAAAAARWSVCAIDVGAGYEGALVAAWPGTSAITLDWDEQ
jgi:4'-phosphopantetheinyl transferase